MSQEHRYGGPWTEIKLDAVEYYLGCYTRALRHVPFDLWYIDAFAGTGTRTFEREAGGLLEGGPLSTITVTVAGSAKRALAVQPAFQHFIFVEQDPERCAALEELRLSNPDRDISIRPGEANAEIRALVLNSPWKDKGASMARGVVFLDPYALDVEWATLVALAETTLLDVWYLFPLQDVVRQLSHDIRGIGPKERRLDLVLGPEWREQLYAVPPATQGDMLEDVDQVARRIATKRQVEQWFKRRLEDHFGFVSEPLPLLTTPNRQTFSLFLAVSSRKKAAVDLAKTFVKYAMKQHGPAKASRRTSAP